MRRTANPIQTEAELRGTVALDRFTSVPVHEFALPPASRASDAERVPVSASTYDALGLLTREQAPNSNDFEHPATTARCRDISYESDLYAEFAVRETIHLRGGCDGDGSDVLNTVALPYDRGLGAPAVVWDMQDQPTRVEYDEFGRMTALYRPKPDVASETSAVAAVKVEYTLPSAFQPREVFDRPHDAR